jgi:hypothetical protein
MERIENLNSGAFRTQGTVDVDVIIPISIAWFPLADCLSITRNGFVLTLDSFYQSTY